MAALARGAREHCVGVNYTKFFERWMASMAASSDHVFELQLASHPIIGRGNVSATDSASACTTRGAFLSSWAQR
jgi:hypothetical protein